MIITSEQAQFLLDCIEIGLGEGVKASRNDAQLIQQLTVLARENKKWQLK